MEQGIYDMLRKEGSCNSDITKMINNHNDYSLSNFSKRDLEYLRDWYDAQIKTIDLINKKINE